MRFSGIIRDLKKKNKKKKIVVASRPDRYDLYHGLIDEFYPLNIPNEKTLQPNCYRLDKQTNREYKELISNITSNFPGYFVYEPSMHGCKKDVFSFNDMNFDYTPRKENKIIIDQIIKNHTNPPNIISLAPRHRLDMVLRNWGHDRWTKLYHFLQSEPNTLYLVIGKSPSYIIPNSEYNNFICIENYITDKTSLIGLTIEALKHSRLTIGSQSSIPLLSLLVKTPVLSWGNQKRRHESDENPRNTYCEFIEDFQYTTSPNKIFELIRKILNNEQAN